MPRERGNGPDGLTAEKRPDYYLVNPPLRPKAEIADYVESQGILVPRRFTGLDDALASGRPFLIRSEHPQDYDGSSDLLHSHRVSQAMLDDDRTGFAYPHNKLDEIPQWRLENEITHESRESIGIYCRFLGINEAEFRSQISYSYWRLLPEYNHTVVADNAVPGKYHIFTREFGYENTIGHGYTTVDGETQTSHYYSDNLPSEVLAGYPELVSFYERVRNLERFDPQHCPTMEIHSAGGANYFLQYHRTQDLAPANFKLKRAQQEKEVKAVFVRGATPKNGTTFKVYIHNEMGGTRVPADEEAAIDFSVTKEVSEIMSRYRKLQLTQHGSVGEVGFYCNYGHLNKSLLFKPGLSVAISREDSRQLREKPKRPPKRHLGGVSYFKIHVVSDGITAYLKRAR